ncbi:TRAP transporter substrate-binding protein [Bordetella sp. BOR01]|uniref:TRAP transporter substrate-binding protein n=1 Tax=Bordetella sp. BOR01 TaxID=2854779 RepID=UPI001C45B7A5|nr:TRAP transporter substrate-binding protein [Bordetella sp. BOR01]MBV7483754.1 TRAP transporter substrate-binding protein [Bordetella sp. BOR01]
MKFKNIAVACLGVLAGAAAINVLAAPEKMRYVGTWSSINLYKDFERPYWSSGKEILGRDLQVSVTSFDQMGLNGSEVFRMLSQGMFDVGTTMSAYAIGSAPELEGVDLPMLVTTPEDSRQIIKLYRPELERIFQERFRGTKLLAISRFPQQGVFCNFPITRLSDLKGKRIRVPGGTSAEFVEALGASPINMPFGEVTAALERKALDCATTGILSAYAVGWHEVTTHFLPVPVGGWGYTMTVMNGRVWKSLSDTDRQALEASIKAKFEEPALKGAEADAQLGIDCLTGRGACPLGQSGKMVMSPVLPEDLALSKKILQEKIIPGWAGRISKEHLDEWNRTIGEFTGLRYDGQGQK